VGHEFEYLRVFESTFLQPKEVARRIASDEYICVYMGYPNITPEDKLIQLREYGKRNPQCWTNDESDRILLNHLSQFIALSKEQKMECEQYGLPYFDCSVEFTASFLEAKNYIMHKLSDA